MTTRLAYQLVPSARVSAGRRGEVQFSRSIHEIIPGTVVRGALGTTWWASPSGQYDGPDGPGTFATLFARSMEVGAAVPASILDSQIAPVLLPISYVRCKYPDRDQGCSSDWRDQAHDVAVGNQEAATRCPACERPFERAKGWVVPDELTCATTRTALQNGAAVSEQLFTRKGLRTSVVLSGALLLRSDVPEAALEWLLAPKTLRVGGQRSTMGTCTWTARIVDVPTTLNSGDVALVLHSPAVLVDGYGAPSGDLSRAVQAIIDETDEHGSGQGEAVREWTRPETVSGWHGISGLPKPEEWAVATGSTVLLTGCDPVALRRLTKGVGLRRLEGFGRLELTDVDDLPTRATEASSWLRNATSPTAVEMSAPPARDGDLLPTADSPASDVDAAGQLLAPSSVQGLLADIDEDKRARTARGLLAQARNVKRMRDNRFPEAIVRQRVENTGTLPWMRDLGGESRRAVHELLVSPDVDAYIHELVDWIGGQE